MSVVNNIDDKEKCGIIVVGDDVNYNLHTEYQSFLNELDGVDDPDIDDLDDSETEVEFINTEFKDLND